MKSQSTSMRILTCLICMILGTGTLLAQTWKWSTVVADKASASYTSITSDDEGNTHVSFIASGTTVKYGFRGVNDARWFTMPIDGGNGWTSIRLDHSGDPRICYAVRAMKYAAWNGKSFSIQEIGPTTGTKEFSCGIGIAPDGTPHVIWYQEKDASYQPYGHLKHAVLKDGEWQVRTVDFDPQTGKWDSIAVDKNGVAHFTYDAFTKGIMKYTTFDGNAYLVRNVDIRGGQRGSMVNNLGMGSSLTLDSAGRPHLSYESNQTIKYAYSPSEGKWEVQTVDNFTGSIGWIGFRTNIVVDSHGSPHIVYDDGGLVKHAFREGNEWRVQAIASGNFSSAAIDKQDRIYVSYRSGEDESLMVATGTLQAAAKKADENSPAQKPTK